MTPAEWFMWFLVVCIGIILFTVVLVGLYGLVVAAVRTTKGLTAGHRKFTEAMLGYAATAKPGGTIPVSLILMEAEQCGVSDGQR